MTRPKTKPPQTPPPTDHDSEATLRSAKASAFSHEVLRAALDAFDADADAIPLDLVMGLAFALSSVLAAHETPPTLVAQILATCAETAARLTASPPPPVRLVCARCGVIGSTGCGLRGIGGPAAGDFALCSRCAGWHRWTDGSWQLFDLATLSDVALQNQLRQIGDAIAKSSQRHVTTH